MKKIFKNNAVSILRAIFFSLLAIMLMFLDHRSASFHRARDKFSVITTPIQFLVDAPIKFTHWIGSSVTAQHQLLAENAELRAHELLLEAKLQKLLTLERENAQLRELLKSSTEITGHVVVAQILAIDLNPSLHQIVADKGVRDKIYLGQPVLDAYGVMGEVVDVGYLTSKILLITDSRFAIPVEDSRNGIRAIAVGLGLPDKLQLIDVPDTSDIKVGDLFVSSGLGLHFPVGYPVGIVMSVNHELGQRFTEITLVPSAHLNQTEQILLAWPSKASMFKAVQEELNKNLPGAPKELEKTNGA